MKYVGPLYAKLGGKYVKLREDSEYVDRLERENANMKRAAEIQTGVFENTIAENTQLQTELTEAKRRIDELERKEYQLKKDNIESLDLLAADTALQNRLADQIESKDKQIIEARAEIERKNAIIEQMQRGLEKISECRRRACYQNQFLHDEVNILAQAALAAERGE